MKHPPFIKKFFKQNKIINKHLYTTTIRTVHYLHCGSSFSYRLCIACNYLYMFSLSSYMCLNCQYLTITLHSVMGTWIARHIIDVPYIVKVTWIAWIAGSAGWWPMSKSYIYCCFLMKRNTFSYNFWSAS